MATKARLGSPSLTVPTASKKVRLGSPALTATASETGSHYWWDGTTLIPATVYWWDGTTLHSPVAFVPE